MNMILTLLITTVIAGHTMMAIMSKSLRAISSGKYPQNTTQIASGILLMMEGIITIIMIFMMTMMRTTSITLIMVTIVITAILVIGVITKTNTIMEMIIMTTKRESTTMRDSSTDLFKGLS